MPNYKNKILKIAVRDFLIYYYNKRNFTNILFENMHFLKTSISGSKKILVFFTFLNKRKLFLIRFNSIYHILPC